MRAWVRAQVGGLRLRVVAIRPLHDGESPWWIQLTSLDGTSSAVVLRTPSSRIEPDLVATNAAALAVAEQHRLPAPRLLGSDLEGCDAGVPATSETVVVGTSRWPAHGSPGLIRTAGAAIAEVHRISVTPRPAAALSAPPHRGRRFAQDRRTGRMPTTALLQLADERVQAVPAPSSRSSSSTATCGPVTR